MIISRESRKSRKIIHRYRSYVAVRMANASEMMRFRVICEIRVRQKAAWNGNIFIMRFPWCLHTVTMTMMFLDEPSACAINVNLFDKSEKWRNCQYFFASTAVLKAKYSSTYS